MKSKAIRFFAGVLTFLLLWSASVAVAAELTTGYRVTIFRWVPRYYDGHGGWTPEPSDPKAVPLDPYIEPYTVVAISPTRDGKVHINNSGEFEGWLWPDLPYQFHNVDPIVSGDPELKKWVESLALAVEDGVLEGYVAHKLVKSGSQLQHDLKTKESILDGRSAIIAMIQKNKVAGSERLSFSDPKIALGFLPAEIRAPGGPREIFPPKPVVEHEVNWALPNNSPQLHIDNIGFKSRRIHSYLTGGKPAEIKSILNRRELGADLLPTLLEFLRNSSFIRVVALDLGIPIPDSIVGETTLTLYNKVYKGWGFSFDHSEADPTLGNELVHMSTAADDFEENGRKIANDRVIRPQLDWHDDQYPQRNWKEFAPLPTSPYHDPVVRVSSGVPARAFERIFLHLSTYSAKSCDRAMAELAPPGFDELFSRIGEKKQP